VNHEISSLANLFLMRVNSPVVKRIRLLIHDGTIAAISVWQAAMS